MQIVVWGINYSPEQIGIAPCTTGLCEFLSRIAKCEVTMLTSFPYYPFGSNSEGRGDSGAAIPKRVKIVRCWPEALAIMGAAGQKFSHEFQWESLLEEYTQSLGVHG
jgi:hypothetical protein